MNKQYLGKSGEFWVAAELLRNGFNVNILPVDSGVDLVATKTVGLEKEQELYQIQVKTTAQKRGFFSFSKEKFNHYIKSGVNLVIVSWPTNSTAKCIVFPFSLLYMMTSGSFKDNKAPLKTDQGKIYFRIEFKDNEIFVRNRKNIFTPLLNRFNLLQSVNADPHSIPEWAFWSEVDGQLIEFDEERML